MNAADTLRVPKPSLGRLERKKKIRKVKFLTDKNLLCFLLKGREDINDKDILGLANKVYKD